MAIEEFLLHYSTFRIHINEFKELGVVFANQPVIDLSTTSFNSSKYVLARSSHSFLLLSKDLIDVGSFDETPGSYFNVTLLGKDIDAVAVSDSILYTDKNSNAIRIYKVNGLSCCSIFARVPSNLDPTLSADDIFAELLSVDPDTKTVYIKLKSKLLMKLDFETSQITEVWRHDFLSTSHEMKYINNFIFFMNTTQIHRLDLASLQLEQITVNEQGDSTGEQTKISFTGILSFEYLGFEDTYAVLDRRDGVNNILYVLDLNQRVVSSSCSIGCLPSYSTSLLLIDSTLYLGANSSLFHTPGIYSVRKC